MPGKRTVLEPEHWEAQYQSGDLPWETGRPATELKRVLASRRLAPCRALEIGCGTGVNAVWLARRGFEVTGVDLSPWAIAHAGRRAAAAGVKVRFLAADVTAVNRLRGRFDFFLDCGCYGAVRLADGGAAGYLRTLGRVTRPGALGLVLVGNAAEAEDEEGPPVVGEWALRREWSALFDVVRLRPFRFDAPRPGDKRYLGWSCLLRRKE